MCWEKQPLLRVTQVSFSQSLTWPPGESSAHGDQAGHSPLTILLSASLAGQGHLGCEGGGSGSLLVGLVDLPWGGVGRWDCQCCGLWDLSAASQAHQASTHCCCSGVLCGAGEMVSAPEPNISVSYFPWVCSRDPFKKSIPQLQAADSSSEHELGHAAQQGVRRVKLVQPAPRLMKFGGRRPTQKRWLLWAVQEKDSAQGPWWMSRQLFFWVAHNPACPCKTRPIQAALPLLEPGVSGCEWDFVHWPFKRAPGFLADSCLWLADRIPADFHNQMLCGHLFWALLV